MKPAANKKTERSQATRAAIIRVACKAFARDGFGDVSLSEIVAQAGVTTGAIYHHFGDKKGLFQAVAEDLEQQILDEVAKVPQCPDDPWGAFVAGVNATLQICARPAIQRIIFQEAPTVIGPAEWRKIEIQYAFGQMRQAVENLAGAGLIRSENHELTTQIILGIIIHAGQGIAVSKDSIRALEEAQDTVPRLLSALRVTAA